MKRILLAPALAALIASSATAGLIITWTETDTALTGTFSGSISAGQLANTKKLPDESVTDNSGYFMDSDSFYSVTGCIDKYVSASYIPATTLPTRSLDIFYSWNSYSGNSGTGDNFGFSWMDNSSNPSFSLYVPVGYTAGSSISGSLTIDYPGGSLLKEQPLSNNTFGVILTSDGAPLVTYVNGNNIGAVPEVTSTFTTLGLITSGLLLRRRTRSLR